MKKIIALILALLSFTAFSQENKIVKKELEAGKVETKMFVLKGDNAWLKTGFILKSTDKVVIKSSGEIMFSNGENHSEIGPNGYGRQAYETDFLLDDAAHCFDPMKEENHAAVIGKDKQSMFLIGQSASFTGKNGPLYIGINDCSFKGKWYNTGQFNVNIKVMRGK
jgi:hypothetical protein